MITVNRDQAAIAARAAARLDAAKTTAIARVNGWAARERSRYITVSPGQDMIYLAKEAEALRYLADPAPVLADYPLIAAELGITAESADQLAQIWAYLGHAWRGLAAGIETTRLGTIAQIEAAQTEGAVAAIAIPT